MMKKEINILRFVEKIGLLVFIIGFVGIMNIEFKSFWNMIITNILMFAVIILGMIMFIIIPALIENGRLKLKPR